MYVTATKKKKRVAVFHLRALELVHEAHCVSLDTSLSLLVVFPM